MATQHIILLVINVLGGAAVIGSYIFGLSAQSGGANVLWGGVPAGIRPLYGISMIISALGYFAFLYYIFFRIDPDAVTIGANFGFALFYALFILILIPSAFWMLLTNLYTANPGAGLWAGIRIVLFIVGLASIALAVVLLSLRAGAGGVAYWLAVAGSIYFAFHTFVLDAIIWAALFK